MKCKKTFAVLMALSIALSMLFCPLNAGAAEFDDFTYEITDNGLNITGYTGSNAEVEILGEYTVNGAVYPVYSIGPEAFLGAVITEIILPEGLKIIGESAFYDCDSLTSVVIPQSVTEVDLYAFDDCNNLTDIVVLNDDLTIGDSAFGYYAKGRNYYVVENLVIKGGEGSSIQQYAKDNGMTFEVYAEPELGDITGDNKLNILDLIRLKKILAGAISADVDINGDGEKTAEDLVTVKILLLIGEENLKTYTVTFKDSDGTVLSRQKVMQSFAAIAPDVPEKEGYKFVGWSADFKNIMRTLIVEALYEKDDTPTFIVNSVNAKAGDRNVIVAVSVKNNPGILGMTLSVQYDESVMTLTNASNGAALSNVLNFTSANVLKSGCNFVWDGQEISADSIKNGEILLLTFNISETAVSGSYPISISYRTGDIIDGNLDSVAFEIENGKITIS